MADPVSPDPKPSRPLRVLGVAAVIAVGVLLCCSGERPPVPTAVSGPATEPRPPLARPSVAAPSLTSGPDLPSDPADRSPRPFRAAVNTRLANGLTVILVEDHTTAQIAAHVVVRAGATADPPGQEGLAHLVEHLLFAGTDRLGTRDWTHEALSWDRLRAALDRPQMGDEELRTLHEDLDRYGIPEEYADIVAELGGTALNAQTTADWTDFHVVLPSNQLEPWAVLEAERFTAPVFRTFVNERQVVREELVFRRECLSPTREMLREALFAGDPYGRPIGGTSTSVAALTIRQAEAFFREWYVPGAMAVVLVGDLDPDLAFEIVDGTFGDLPAGQVPSPRRGTLHAAAPAVSRFEPRRTHGFAWALPADEPPEVVEVLATALESRVKAARDTPRFRPSVAVTRWRHGGMLSLSGSCGPESCAPAVEQAVRDLRTNGVGPRDLARAIRSRWVTELRRLEDPDVQAGVIAAGWARGEDPSALWDHLRRMETLTVRQVDDAIDRLLVTDLRDVAAPPRPKSPPAGTVQRHLVDVDRSRFAEGVLAIPTPPLVPRWIDEGQDYTSTPDGRITAAVNPENTLFQADLVWNTGWWDDPQLCFAVLRWQGGESDDSPQGALTDRGIRFERPVCTADELRIRIEGLGSAAPFALPALRSLLADPRIEKEANIGALTAWTMGGPVQTAWGLHPPARPNRRRLIDTPIQELEASVRALAGLTPDVWYVGPADAATVGGWVGAEPRAPARSSPPLVSPVGPTLEIHPFAGLGTVELGRVSEPYEPSREPLYALYETWLRREVQKAFRTEAGSVYRQDVAYVRGRRPGEPNSLRVGLSTSIPEIEATLDALIGIVAGSVPSERAWAHTFDVVDAGVQVPVPFREVPAHVAAARDHGFPGDDRAAVSASLPTFARDDFSTFVAEESARPYTLVLEGPLTDDAAARVRAKMDR